MSRKHDAKIAQMVGQPIGEKMDMVEQAVRRDGEQTRTEYKKQIGEVKQVVDVIVDDLSSREKKELYDLNTLVDIASLDDTEKEFLLAALYTLSDMTEVVAPAQQDYIRSVKNYLRLKDVQTTVDLSCIENIDNLSFQKAILQCIMEFLFLENDSHSYLQEYEDVISYFSVNKNGIAAIKLAIDNIFRATGELGLSEMYGYVPVVEAVYHEAQGALFFPPVTLQPITDSVYRQIETNYLTKGNRYFESENYFVVLQPLFDTKIYSEMAKKSLIASADAVRGVLAPAWIPNVLKHSLSKEQKKEAESANKWIEDHEKYKMIRIDKQNGKEMEVTLKEISSLFYVNTPDRRAASDSIIYPDRRKAEIHLFDFETMRDTVIQRPDIGDNNTNSQYYINQFFCALGIQAIAFASDGTESYSTDPRLFIYNKKDAAIIPAELDINRFRVPFWNEYKIAMAMSEPFIVYLNGSQLCLYDYKTHQFNVITQISGGFTAYCVACYKHSVFLLESYRQDKLVGKKQETNYENKLYIKKVDMESQFKQEELIATIETPPLESRAFSPQDLLLQQLYFNDCWIFNVSGAVWKFDLETEQPKKMLEECKGSCYRIGDRLYFQKDNRFDYITL